MGDSYNISLEKVMPRATMFGEDGGVMSERVHVRLGAVVLVLLLAVMAGSGVRLILPGLKESTRSPVPHRSLSTKVGRWRVSASWTARWQPLRASIRRLGTSPPPAAGHPLLPEAMPPTRSPGEDALGTSVPKRLRWTVTGGHGRNGAG